MTTTKHIKKRQDIIYQNELLKRNYFDYLKDTKGYANNSIDSYERAILVWEEFAPDTDFGAFSKKRAKEFKSWLADRKTKKDKLVSSSYKYQILRKLKHFFEWLHKQEKYRSRYNETDVELLNLSKKESREARNSSRKPIPSLQQVKKVIEGITVQSEIDRRDKALLSLTLLTGIRITALASLPIQAFQRNQLVVNQDTKLGVKTKFSKSFPTAFFPLTYKEPQQYFLDWFDYLVDVKKFQPTEPIFPATEVTNGKKNISYFSSKNVSRDYWKSSGSARKIFEKRFTAAGITYYHPHSFRHLIVKELSRMSLTEQQKKAISQNFGHANVSTTFGSYGYGQIAEDQQIDLVSSLDWDDAKTQGVVQLTNKQLEELLKKAAR